MTLKTCLRCDWQGETKEPGCPNCGEPLYVVGALPSEEAGMPAGGHPEERSREAASTSSVAPYGTSFPKSNPSPSPTDGVGSSSRSARSVVAFVLAALVSIVALGTLLKAHEERSAPAASTDAAVPETPASDDSPSPKLAGIDSIKLAHVGRHSITVDGVPFSFSVPTSGWERFGSISINKSTVGPQGAEAMIYWTIMSDDAYADPCGQGWGSPVGSVADWAANASRMRGTELVTRPSDVTVGGRAAKYVVFTVRRDVGCDPGFFYTWPDVMGGAFWGSTDVGDTIRVWLVEVGRKVLFIEGDTRKYARFDLEREIQQIVGSIRFD